MHGGLLVRSPFRGGLAPGVVEKLGVGREMVNGVNTGKGAFAEAASPKTKISRSSSSHANEPRQSPRWRGKFSDLPWSTENAGYAGLHLEGPGRSLPERGKGVGPLGRRPILTWMSVTEGQDGTKSQRKYRFPLSVPPEVSAFCPWTLALLVHGTTDSVGDLNHQVPDSQTLRPGLSYTTSFPGSLAFKWQTVGLPGLYNHVNQFL